jgi:pimeloyl-ACP methyl ester carboxylesterase
VYGAAPDEWLAYVPADTDAAPLVVLLHDGAWGALAAAAHAAGHAFAWVHHTTNPVEQVRRAVDWLIDAPSLGHDPRRVVVVGHAGGAALAAMVAVHDPRPTGFVLVSGAYDAAPLDPLHLLGASNADCVVAWGAEDTCEVRHQGQVWATVWSMIHWNRQAIVVEASGRRQIDVLDDLFDRSTALGTAVHDVLRSVRQH